MTKLYEKRANKGRKKMLFEPGDLVWVHLRKDRFSEQRKSKLQPRADGPFKVLRKINDNAYEINLPSTYGVSTSFNVADLSPFFGLDKSRMTPFQEGEDHMTIPASKKSQAPSQATTTQLLPTPTPAQVIDGPVTRSRAKKIQQEVHALLCEIHFNINENYILPKCCILIILKYIEEEKDESDSEERTGASPRRHYKMDQNSQKRTSGSQEWTNAKKSS